VAAKRLVGTKQKIQSGQEDRQYAAALGLSELWANTTNSSFEI
jgi:hypothetical protein